jgi:hypothetical protein
VTTYYINQFPQPPLEIEIEGAPPCLFCGETVDRPSTDGPLVCAWCDCGRNRDGSKWSLDQATERYDHRRERIAKYRDEAADRAAAKEPAS